MVGAFYMPKKKEASVKSKQKYPSTQQWLDIAEIKNGITTLKSGQLVAVIEIQPVNFNFMSVSEQNHILSLYKGFLDSIPCPVQLLSVALPINLDRYYDVLQQDFLRCDNSELQIMIKAQEEFVRGMVEDMQILKRRHFVIVWAPPVKENDGIKQYLPFRQTHARGSDRRLLEYVQQVRGAMGGMGIENDMLGDARLMGLLTNMLNPAV